MNHIGKQLATILAVGATACLVGIGAFWFSPSPLSAQAQTSEPWPYCLGGFRQERLVDCVVDGDTFYRSGVAIRLSCINTPEVTADTAAEAQRAADAAAYLARVLGEPHLLAMEGRTDRFGRSLGSVDLVDPHTWQRTPIEDGFVATGLAEWSDYPESRAFCAGRSAS